MFSLPGYQVTLCIYKSLNSLVYRGIRQSDHLPVVLKVLQEDYPTPQELTRYRQEYEITRSLNLDGVIQTYGLETYQNTLIILLEDFGGDSLAIWLRRQQESGKSALLLSEFFPLAIRITEILGRIHAAGIIHKDINPSNIIYNSQTQVLKIIDFGIATRFKRETPPLKNPNLLEGTLAYISPEQTGRMNFSLDYRTDFYSLGMMFYELLTGKVPFEAQDPLEWVHCHLAIMPTPPREFNPTIPDVLSDLVMKLLAKNADERYQSAWGIQADLVKCQQQWEAGEEITFALAQQDVCDRFQIPQKLYGREREVAALLAAFEQVANVDDKAGRGENQGSETSEALIHRTETFSSPYFFTTPCRERQRQIVLVSGYSGVGKTSLVQELYKPITARRGYFIAGKFDQFQRDIPYSAVVSALTELVRQLLSETETQLSQWRDKLLAALGNNGQIIIEVIPELELIIGKQPPVPELGTQETQNRFNLVFQSFIRIFCSPKHPLVVFLDDLQWADAATFNWIKLILTDNQIESLLLIGAYRDNEVSPNHVLMLTLEQLQKEGIFFNQISLAPLGFQQVSQLIAETLQSRENAVKTLAQLVWQKTEGNPFFVNEFLTTLYTKGLIWFDWATRNWKWNLAQIQSQGMTDNVVELMARRVQELPTETEEILKLASCIGSEFDLSTLSAICEKTLADIYARLVIAIQSGLIVARSPLDEQLLIQEFKFGHDRIQQATFSLIPERDRSKIHLQIGRLLLNQISVPEKEGKIFNIVNHLNVGIELFKHQLERDKLAQLNLIAGRKAKASTAYAAAVDYLNTGLSLLTTNCWQDDYTLAFTFYFETAETEYLNTNLEQAEKLCNQALNSVKNTLDEVKLYELKIKIYLAQNQIRACLDTGLQVLEKLDISLSQSLPEELSQTSYIEQLTNLPRMTDAGKLAAMKILILLYAPACFVGEGKLILPIIYTVIELSRKYGNSPSSTYAYAIYGIIAAWLLLDIDLAYALGQLSWKLVKKLNAKDFESKALVAVLICIFYKKRHIKETVELLHKAIEIALEVGDIEFAGHAANYYCDHLFFVGENLEYLAQIQAKYINFIQDLKQQHPLLLTKIGSQLVLNLLTRLEKQCSLVGTVINEEDLLPHFLETNNVLATFNVYLGNLILCYLFGDYSSALEKAELAFKYTDYIKANYSFTLLNFFYSLALLRKYPHASNQASNNERDEYLEKVAENQKLMKLWTQHAPMNFQHKYDLVEAEKARVLGRLLEAMEYYDRAIAGAKQQGFIQEEALASELAAKFYLEQGRTKIAQLYMQDAHYYYRQWGAIAKVEDLEKRYPQLLNKIALNLKNNNSNQRIFRSTVDSISNQSSSLDLAAIMQASQALSEEIVLERLLKKLMRTILESAGAQQGWLLLEQAGQWLIQAAGTVEVVSVLQSISLAEDGIGDRFPKTLISYVTRTRESVVLNHASEEGQFIDDPYIKRHQSKSVLCTPLVHQGNLRAIAYLENNLTVGAFTRERTEVVKLLCAQAAISLENAQLYAEKEAYACLLEQKVAERTAELEQANRELQRLANLDGLTQVGNRRRFDEYLTQEWKRLLREQHPLGLILCDVDYFKNYNDFYGHQSGDECLKQVVNAISRAVKRPADLVARYGGEEFAVILPLTDASGVVEVAQAIQREVQQLQLPHATSEVSQFLTLSLGMTSVIPSPPVSPETLIALADAALYQAKQQGRNRWVYLPNSAG